MWAFPFLPKLWIELPKSPLVQASCVQAYEHDELLPLFHELVFRRVFHRTAGVSSHEILPRAATSFSALLRLDQHYFRVLLRATFNFSKSMVREQASTTFKAKG